MMRSARFVPPVALLAAACAGRLPSPSSGGDDWAAPPPMPREITVPARSDVLARWALPPEDPWAPYAKYTLFAALGAASAPARLPDVESIAEVQRARAAGAALGAAGLPAGTLWIVDMRGATSVAFGTGLVSTAGASAVSLVPTFNNWPARGETVPAEETLAALVTMSPGSALGGLGADASGGPHPVFLLDAWRLAYKGAMPDDFAYDNRYALTQADFPDAETLRARGIRRVVYVVANLDETRAEEDDLHRMFLAWQGAGVAIAMTDLEGLSAIEVEPDWPEMLVNLDVEVPARMTIFDDGAFHRRAHGGFGGFFARPSSLSMAHGGSMHGGGG